MKLINVKIRYILPLLGSTPANKSIFTDFVAAKADPPLSDEAIQEEADAITEADKPGITVFPRNADGQPIRFNYQVRGFFKEACQHLRRVKGTKSAGVKAFKKIIDGTIFVEPREIPLEYDGEIEMCERPLRAETAQGARVALSCSEQIPAGATEEFVVRCMNDADVNLVAEWLEFGRYHGSGQWRNSGIGSFEVEKFEVHTAPELTPSFQITEV